MQGHNPIIFDRLRGAMPDCHVIVQVCQFIDSAIDNPIVIARSWADADKDWSFLKGLTVELMTSQDTDFYLTHALAKAIQAAKPRQLFMSFEDTKECFAVFWRDHKRENIDYVPVWN
jgi:hypothetical protein